MKKEKISGDIQFDNYYKDIYKDRWVLLKESLLKENTSKYKIPNLKSDYFIDYASKKVANSLPLKDKDNVVLDMCSAPGGKALVIAQRMEESGELYLNELSRERRERLRGNIEACLNEENKKNISITPYDGSKIGLFQKEKYTSILLDAPCSSERHVINDKKYLSQWSLSRPKRLAITQYSLLSSALLSLKKGGYILYSTCSINDKENEDVVGKLFFRHKNEVEEIKIKDEILFIEYKEYGGLILPDKNNGIGPIYFALIRKKDE